MAHGCVAGSAQSRGFAAGIDTDSQNLTREADHHPIELLYTLMGTGCESVTRTSTPDTDVVVGKLKNGKIGTVRAIRPYADYGAIVNRGRETTVSHPKEASDYRPLVVEILKFFQTGKPPVPNEETLEIFAFLDAAQRSKEQGGQPVALR